MRQTASSVVPRKGVTLIELIVVLALLGLVLALAAPTFVVPDRGVQSRDLSHAIATARRTAIARAEPVTLAVDEAGGWVILGRRSATVGPVSSGRFARPTGSLRVHVSPLGTCVVEPTGAAATPTYNAVSCAPLAATPNAGSRP